MRSSVRGKGGWGDAGDSETFRGKEGEDRGRGLREVEFEIQEKGYQIRATNSLQTKVDELRALALVAGADTSAVNTIFNRPL